MTTFKPHAFMSLFALIVVATLSIMPETAQAAGATLFEGMGDGILKLFTNKFLTSIATIALIASAFGALTGRIAWMWFFGVVLFIVVAFGAPSIVEYIKTLAAK